MYCFCTYDTGDSMVLVYYGCCLLPWCTTKASKVSRAKFSLWDTGVGAPNPHDPDKTNKRSLEGTSEIIYVVIHTYTFKAPLPMCVCVCVCVCVMASVWTINPLQAAAAKEQILRRV